MVIFPRLIMGGPMPAGGVEMNFNPKKVSPGEVLVIGQGPFRSSRTESRRQS